jgi:hypothetical protein
MPKTSHTSISREWQRRNTSSVETPPYRPCKPVFVFCPLKPSGTKFATYGKDGQSGSAKLARKALTTFRRKIRSILRQKVTRGSQRNGPPERDQLQRPVFRYRAGAGTSAFRSVATTILIRQRAPSVAERAPPAIARPAKSKWFPRPEHRRLRRLWSCPVTMYRRRVRRGLR